MLKLIRTALTLALAGSAAPAQQLDYDFFKERVQPIFLKKREGHARCVACHSHRSPPLEHLEHGQKTWTDEQARKNFEMWSQFVTPGKPLESRMLVHTLRPHAGGDGYHAGGKHFDTQNDAEWQTLAAWVNGATLDSYKSGVVRVLQSNAAGDDIHVIDPATNKVVGRIEGVEVPHGVTISPDGRRIYVSNEALVTLDAIDAKTFEVVARAPLSGRPNNCAVSNDGKKVYVAVAEDPGWVDVIDTATMKKVKAVPVNGRLHNVYVTPDGKYAVAGAIPAKTISVVDTTTDELAWTLTLDAGIRPMVFPTNPDGSTKQIVTQLSNFHGFAVVDFSSRKVVRRIELPAPPGHEKEEKTLQGSPAHGLAITPDGKTLWSTSKWYDSVVAYSLPDYKLRGIVEVGHHPDWIAIPPDGKNVYVAAAGDDETVVVDNETLEVVDRIPVGSVPKRVVAGVLRRD